MGKFIKIKFCGLKQQTEVDFCTQNNVDFLGFVFYSKSPRNIILQNFQHLNLVNAQAVVAVFKNPNIREINAVLQLNRVDFIQIHGNNTDDTVQYFNGKIGLIKAFSGNYFSEQELGKYNFCNYFLFDGATEGSGLKRDFSFAKNLPTKKPFFLAGGINSSNLHAPLQYTNYIDLSSGIEERHGEKSIKMMEEFLKKSQCT